MSMKAAVFKEKNGKLEVVQMPIPEPQPRWVRIKVEACGVCHSDFFVKYGGMGNKFPRVPGHEVIGKVDKLGQGVNSEEYGIGKMVGVGWFGGNHCGKCEDCKENEWVHCKESYVCGIHYDGGYAEYMTAPADSLVPIPDCMDPVESAPLLCAGVTVFNSFRNQNIKAPALVGVQGIGGLGHLAIQFCKKMGFEVIALSSGNSKEQLTKELGAHYYVDTSKDGYIDKVKSIGSVKCILVTAPFASAVPGLLECLGTNGKLVILAAFKEPFNASSITMIGGSKSIIGWSSGDSRDSSDTFHFARNNQVKPMVKSFTLEEANEALEGINNARFRNVIKM
ncbi:hypothetical protein ACTFIW_011852 [Dictyostelium discoideum]